MTEDFSRNSGIRINTDPEHWFKVKYTFETPHSVAVRETEEGLLITEYIKMTVNLTRGRFRNKGKAIQFIDFVRFLRLNLLSRFSSTSSLTIQNQNLSPDPNTGPDAGAFRSRVPIPDPQVNNFSKIQKSCFFFSLGELNRLDRNSGISANQDPVLQR